MAPKVFFDKQGRVLCSQALDYLGSLRSGYEVNPKESEKVSTSQKALLAGLAVAVVAAAAVALFVSEWEKSDEMHTDEFELTGRAPGAPPSDPKTVGPLQT